MGLRVDCRGQRMDRFSECVLPRICEFKVRSICLLRQLRFERHYCIKACHRLHAILFY
ncbi:MAG: hypothetical protein ACKERG_00915 [Candidatus Hodgkinia cicadicola]